MRFTILFFAIVFSQILLGSDQPTLPASVKLTNGAVLKNISVIRWNSDGVVLKHAGGADPIRFVHIDPSQRSVFEALATLEKNRARSGDRSSSGAESTTTFSGQAFVVTKGAGSYKLGGMKIYIFPAGAETAFQTYTTVELPQPMATVVTDADGRFSFSLPQRIGFFLFSQGRRMVRSGDELYEWRLSSGEIKDPGSVLLTNENLIGQHSRVRIAE